MGKTLLTQQSYILFIVACRERYVSFSARSIARNSVRLGDSSTAFAVIKALPLIDNLRA